MKTSLFKRPSLTKWRFLFFVLLSLSFIVADSRQSVFTQTCREWLSFSAEPVRFLANWPTTWLLQVKENFSSRQDLLLENSHLKMENERLFVVHQKWRQLQQENQALHVLLSTIPQIDGHVVGVRVQQMNRRPLAEIFLLDKGRANGAFVGQPVLGDHGLIGRVIRVDWFYSVVLPITNDQSAIPVEALRTSERGIVSGTDTLEVLALDNIPKTTSIKAGDWLVTSSLGKKLPSGYPVGRVEYVEKNAAHMFADIRVLPATHVQQNQMVFLLWPATPPKSYIASMDDK